MKIFFFSVVSFVILMTGFLTRADNSAFSAAAKKVAAASTNFGFDLYSRLAAQNSSQNIFISPTSIGFCLSMTYNGAAGETARTMGQAMRLNGITTAELNNAYLEMRNRLHQPASQVQIEIANSLWAKRGISFLPEFLNLNRAYFGAEVTDVNFNDPAAPSMINSWVNQKTKGKIDKIVDQIDSNSVLYLINAIYFKGKWSKQFDRNQTKDGAFTTASGSVVRGPMMRRSGNFQYMEGDHFQSITLPYGDGTFAMYVFLPAKEMDLHEFAGKLSADNWDAWMSQYQEAEGDVLLPRFRIEYETELNAPLKAQGMGVAFDPGRADFSRMLHASEKAFLSKVKHKAFVDVNEEGTEAAAATSSEIQIVSMVMPTKKFHFVADHPFFFAIRDNKSGALLFVGSVNQL